MHHDLEGPPWADHGSPLQLYLYLMLTPSRLHLSANWSTGSSPQEQRLSYFQTPQLIFTGASLLFILLFCIYVISPKKHYMWPSNDQVGANMLLVLTCLSHLTVNLLREGIFMSPIECPKMLSMVMAQKHLSNKSASREVKLWLPDYESLYLWIFF